MTRTLTRLRAALVVVLSLALTLAGCQAIAMPPGRRIRAARRRPPRGPDRLAGGARHRGPHPAARQLRQRLRCDFQQQSAG